MGKKKVDLFAALSWDDLTEWAGSKIVNRGKSYQLQNLVSKLATVGNNSLFALVDGTHIYGVHVTIKDGKISGMCSCPYRFDCKHGVAVVLEYLESVRHKKIVPNVNKNDECSSFIEKNGLDDIDLDMWNESVTLVIVDSENTNFSVILKNKTKSQLVKIIESLAEKFPQIIEEIGDLREIGSENVKKIIKQLKKMIKEVSEEPGWQNYWQGDGYTPDYSRIRTKLASLLDAGYANDVVDLGNKLIELGNNLVGESDDEGETAMEIESCLPVIVQAVQKSSMDKVAQLMWAIDIVLKDEYGIFDVYHEFLDQRHAKKHWNMVADQLFEKLDNMKHINGDKKSSRSYERDRLSGWVIFALERCGRDLEIIPLCKKEAPETGSYVRLVKYLIADKCYDDAQQWIQEGIEFCGNDWAGIVSNLRDYLKEIKAKLQVRKHRPIGETGRWLRRVVQGWLNYHGVPSNSQRLCQYVDEVIQLWLAVIRRRSQRGRNRWTWVRMQRLARLHLPRPRITHPYPDKRFHARLKVGAV